jgi:hypothetical protein
VFARLGCPFASQTSQISLFTSGDIGAILLLRSSAMQRIILLSLFALLASDASAQHRGGVGLGFGRSGFSRGGPRQALFNRGPSVFPYGFGYGYGFGDNGFLPYDVGTAYGYSPQPIIIVMQPPPPAFVQQPPREARPVIINYAPSAPAPSAPAEGEPQPFGLVLKDGSTRSAIAVVAGTSDGVLHYVDQEDRNMRISMSEVDHEATQKLNRGRKLILWPSATPQSTTAPAPSH